MCVEKGSSLAGWSKFISYALDITTGLYHPAVLCDVLVIRFLQRVGLIASDLHQFIHVVNVVNGHEAAPQLLVGLEEMVEVGE